jgi:pilus assembly protein Flp/PilA
MTKLSSLKTKLSAFTADESGATLIEYALIAAILAVGLVATLGTLRGKLGGSFSNSGAVL